MTNNWTKTNANNNHLENIKENKIQLKLSSKPDAKILANKIRMERLKNMNFKFC